MPVIPVGTPQPVTSLLGVAQGATVDVLRVCTTPGGQPVLDLADGVRYSYAPDSLLVDPTGQSVGSGLILDQASGATSQPDERYGGSIVDWDLRPNGILQWRAIVAPSSAGTVNSAMGILDAEIERVDAPFTRFIEWRRVTAVQSLFYERRGPGTYTIVERWEDGQIAVIDVMLPVAPICYGPPTNVTTLTAQNAPATWTLPQPGGGALGALPARMDVTTQQAAALKWALIAGTSAPFGVVEAESASSKTGFTVAGDGTARGSSKLTVSSTSPGSFGVPFDPSQAALDAYEYERDVAVEVFARVQQPVGSTTCVLSAITPDGALTVYSLDYGSTGKTLVQNRTGAGWALYRLGLLRLPSDSAGSWTIQAAFSRGWSGPLDVDYLILAPARQRATSPTGVPNDSTYPPYTPVSSSYFKTVRSNLSAKGGPTSPPAHFERGLGGAALRCPNIASPLLLIAASPSVPDDPSTAGAADTPMPSITPTVTTYPRYLLADAS